MAKRPPIAPFPDIPLTLITLGSAALARPGVERPILGPGKPLALLIYLAFSPSRSATREHLTDLLWNDTEPERARHALRQTLWQLRALLGEDVLSGREEITLLRPFDSDRDQFLAAVARGDLDTALGIYRGPLLPGFASPGGAGFEHWADLERDQLAATFVRTSETQVRRLLASGHARDALNTARRLIALGGPEELGRRLALEAHLASADMISAATEADALERWAIAEEEPLEPATRDAVRRARKTDSDPESRDQASAAPVQLIGELVGREQEFAQILEGWTAARAGNHRHLHLLAPAGLGKTRLLRDLEARLTAMRGTVRYIRANPGDRSISGALLGDTARTLSELPGAMGVSPSTAAVLVALEPSLSNRYSAPPDSSTGDEARRRRMLALSELATTVASEAPFALLIDDMHWADAESHAVLEGVTARLVGTASLLVTASRPVAERHFRSDQRVTLQLDPLDGGQISAFLMSLGRLSDEGATTALPSQLLAATSGSPLLVIEMLQLALERGALALIDGQWAVSDAAALAEMLREGEGIRQRIARLGDTSRQILAVLAAAGAPLSVKVLINVTGADRESAESHLAALERTGFATHIAAGWQPAHDEIADQALPSSPGERDAIDRALGYGLLPERGEDHTVGVRAAQHLARVADVPALARLATSEVRRRGRLGQDQKAGLILAELIPGDASLRQRVYAALPVSTRMRYGRYSHLLMAGAASAAMLLLAAFGMMRLQPKDDQRLVVFTAVDSTRQVATQVSLRATDWRPGDTLRQSSMSRWLRRCLSELPPVGGNVTIWADGDSAIYSHAFATEESGGQDLVLLARGEWSRVASAPHDDVAPTLSPDRRQVAFLSARWSPDSLQDNDVAVVELATNVVSHLTTSRDIDRSPSWSPDGTRIAFLRQGYQRSDSIQRFCTMAANGSGLRCRTIAGYEPLYTLGWIDWQSILLVAQGPTQQILVRITITGLTDSVVVFDPTPVETASLSPDRRWVACWCQPSSVLGARLEVRPVGQPSAWRPVAMSDSADASPPSWIDTHPDSTWLASIRIEPPGHVVMGSAHGLKYSSKDARGMPATFDTLTVRWSSSDTTVATIDSLTGVVHASRGGSVWLRITAGGWRADSVQVHVDPFVAEVKFRESWLDLRQWGSLGTPQPEVVSASPVGRAFWNHGDGANSSGAWSHMAIDATHGLALDADVSTPLSRINWQTVNLEFGVIDDTGAYVLASGSDMSPRLDRDERARRCGVGYPNGEGGGSDRRVAIDAGGRNATPPRPSDLSSGKPWHVRVQVFDDGTCGIAINGQPLYRSLNAIRLDRPMHVLIEGNSVGTRVLVGPLTVWSGDPGGVNWESLKQEVRKAGPH